VGRVWHELFSTKVNNSHSLGAWPKATFASNAPTCMRIHIWANDDGLHDGRPYPVVHLHGLRPWLHLEAHEALNRHPLAITWSPPYMTCRTRLGTYVDVGWRAGNRSPT
jgi:hypothetical protein